MGTLYSNPQVARFCNEALRPLADDIVRLSLAVQHVLATSSGQGILAILQSVTDQTQIIDDGSSVDGRPPVNVGQVVAFLTECQAANAALATTTAVQQANAIQVNGYPQ